MTDYAEPPPPTYVAPPPPAGAGPPLPAPDGAGEAERVTREYFGALAGRDVEGMVACWTPGGIEHLDGQLVLEVPGGVRTYFSEVFNAFPDFTLDWVSTVSEADTCAIRWQASATFVGGPFQGLEPTGARLELRGTDVIQVKDGKVVRNDAILNEGALGRELGAAPPAGSKAEERLKGLLNRRSRLAGRMVSAPERVADGVWVLRGGIPRFFNVYAIEHGGELTVFDAGSKAMVAGLATQLHALGTPTRLVLGHGHADHRGAAPGLGLPVWCGEREVPVAEGDGGWATFDFQKLNPIGRRLIGPLLNYWDGGPVKIAGTLAEGDEVAGFRVVPTPGHSVGQIALWRESDRLALTTDTFYTLDPETTIKGAPRLPHEAFTPDVPAARESIRRIAELNPVAAWPGHADPVLGNVRDELLRAAEA
jgi:glyoxylase-like metal-dependent hydrolase (beta-lactamase superfamily II)/predicted ester cyclase